MKHITHIDSATVPEPANAAEVSPSAKTVTPLSLQDALLPEQLLSNLGDTIPNDSFRGAKFLEQEINQGRCVPHVSEDSIHNELFSV